MTRAEAMEEMLRGYMDGLLPGNPEPSGNRSNSYRHGFANGRDDWRRMPRAPAQINRGDAEKAILADIRI